MFSKDDSTAALAIPRVVEFGYREFVVTGDKQMATDVSWLRGPAVEHRSLAGVLSLSCVRLVADG